MTAPSLIPRPLLPLELIQRIADFLFQPLPPTRNCSEPATIRCVKPLWPDVVGFMWASASLHEIGFRRWLRIISVRSVEDWEVITQYIGLVREIQCFDGTLLDHQHQHILSKIPHLHTAIIDTHSDVWHGEHNHTEYRDIISALPPSLKRLEIQHAHGPDMKIISLVKNHCPNLEELRFGRCTMFNRSPACGFWQRFPFNHDSYMSDIGTDAYAEFLGDILSPLKRLRALRIGLYLVPSDIVLSHRLYHRPSLPAPEIINWQTAIPLAEQPTNQFLQGLPRAPVAQLISLLHRCEEDPRMEFECSQCIEITSASGSLAEQRANAILRTYLPTLNTIEWMGWLTPQHLGINAYHFSS